jgi:monoamine oxidase
MRITDTGRLLRRYLAANREARGSGQPLDEVFGRSEEARARELADSLQRSAELQPLRERAAELRADGANPYVTRRELLQQGALVSAGLAGLTLFGFGRRAFAAPGGVPGKPPASAPRIVVVGAGLAGLAAAYRIHQTMGLSATLYEGQDRVGGRVRTIRSLDYGHYIEAGPSGIGSSQMHAIKRLADDVGLTPLDDLWLNYPSGGNIYVFDGQRYRFGELAEGFGANQEFLWQQWLQIRKLPTYLKYNAAAAHWDSMTVAELFDEHLPFGSNTPEGAVMLRIFEVAYAGRAGDTSALMQIANEGTFWQSENIYDERLGVPGGNHTLAQAVADALPDGSLQLDHQLLAIKRNADLSYTLTFSESGRSPTDVVADQVVLAIPPSTLRDVDYSQAGFSAVKDVAIQNQDLGPNSKINIQFEGHPWADLGFSGGIINGDPSNVGWTWQDSHLGTIATTLIMMNNNDYGDVPPHGLAPSDVVSETLAELDFAWGPTGVSTSAIPGQAYLDYWHNDPWVKGSYSYYPPGGFTGFAGAEHVREGNVHFAGEHTARYTQRGYMNGAVESGERAAREIMLD